MPVPNTFANATATIPLSQLDANFATTITLGNTAIQLGNTVSTLNNMTLANVTVSSGNVTITNVTVTTANVTTANIATAQIANVTVSGTGTFAAGSNTAPSITTSGDTNTGIFFPAADTIAFTEGGVESMRLDSSGNLGLATTSISTAVWGSTYPKLAIGTTTNAGVLQFQSTAAAANNKYLGGVSALNLGSGVTANESADILFYQDGTSATNPGGRISFFTRTDAGSVTEKMRLDNAGNLGLGVTPSTISTGKNLEVGFPGNSIYSYSQTDFEILSNAYYNGGYKFGGTGRAMMYAMGTAGSGIHSWHTSTTSGTAGNAITFTQAMTLDASGRLGVGTTNPSGFTTNPTAIVINSATGTGYSASAFQAAPVLTLYGGGGSGNATGTRFSQGGGFELFFGGVQESGGAAAFVFQGYTGSAYTERARITSGGYFKAQGNSSYVNSAVNFHELVSATNDTEILYMKHNGSSGTQYGITLVTANDQNNAGLYFLKCFGGPTERFTARTNGGLANYSANNVNLASDQRLKKDVSPLATTWDKVKQIEVVNFRYKDCNEGDPFLYGVIAQQVQPIVPELVVVTQEAKEATEDTEATPEYYGIREQPMYWLAIKALQEAMTRIEALEAEVQALKGNA